MPSSGLSLVGFMDGVLALQHFKSACIPPSADDIELNVAYQKAKEALGAPFPNFGEPDIQDILPQYAGYVGALSQFQWVAEALATYDNPTFKMVEIDPLLAYQFTIDVERVDHHCGKLNNPPSVEETLGACLPHAQPSEHYQISPSINAILIKSKSLNLRMLGAGVYNGSFVGAQIGVSLTLAHVVKFNGKYYLHNGYHRALGIRKSGGTHIPCIVREVKTAQEAGIVGNGTTFTQELLESNNPPTLGHFTQGRAMAVKLRSNSRIIQVSWSEHVVPDE